jgi:hypothetical protein
VNRAALLLLFFILAGTARAQDAEDLRWLGRTAYVAPRGHLEGGLLQPLRWSVGRGIELATHPWWFALSPNLQVKVALKRMTFEETPMQLSMVHTVHYPSLWLRAVAREGAGGLLPANSDIPSIVATTHSVLATRPLADAYTLTTQVGVRLAWRMGTVDMPTLDLPLFYPRMAPYYGDVVLQGGISVDGRFARRLGLLGDAMFFIIPSSEGLFAFEQTSRLTWQPGRRLALAAGYRFIYGGYPYGADIHVFPLVDLKWTIRR